MLKTVHSLEAEIIKLNEEADYNEIARLKAEELYQSVITALTTAENELTAKDKMIADLESERASNQDTQEINFETSEAILSSMQEKLDASSETVKMSTQELEACQERERALAARCIELETQVGDKAKNNRSLQSKSKINVYLFVHCITCNCFEQSLFFL